MAYPQVIIPPSVKPVSPMELTLADDLTTPFAPRFARGATQRQTWGDPIWSAQVRFEALRAADRALVKAAIGAARGGASNILVTPGIPLRGSFPATELLTNNDFSNGTTGWTAVAGSGAVSAQDGTLRLKRTANTGASLYVDSSSATVTQYAPYVGRFMASAGVGVHTSVRAVISSGSIGHVGTSATSLGSMLSIAAVLNGTAAVAEFEDTTSGQSAGDSIDLSWSSLSRCALIDSGPNALTYSDQIDNAAWTKSGATITANADTAPDGSVTADRITEDTSTGAHYFYPAAAGTRASAAADCVAYGYFKQMALDRDVRLIVSNGAFTNYGQCIADLSAGTVGGVAAVGSATNARAFIASAGSGWYFVAVVARLPVDTTVTTQAVLVSGGSITYTGTTGALSAWRIGAAVSAVPTRGAQTTSAATTGTSQTGNSIYLKGLPASTSGLLLAGDFFEVNGELMQCTASLDSDAAGLGVLQMHRAPMTPLADNDPVIILNPFGRFRVAQDPRITERFGVYTDVDLALIEATA